MKGGSDAGEGGEEDRVESCVASGCWSGATVLLRPAPAVDFGGCPRGVHPRERLNPNHRTPHSNKGRETEGKRGKSTVGRVHQQRWTHPIRNHAPVTFRTSRPRLSSL